MPMQPRSSPRRGIVARRPRVEGLEDRRLLATLLAGFSEAAVATGLANASAMEVAPDGRLWVLEQGGSVKVFHAGSTAGATALAIPAPAIDARGERGLLGIAFDPGYDGAGPAPDHVYLYYTSTAAPNPHNRISRFAVNNADPDRPTLSGEAVLVELEPLSGATNHNGGAIHFGPDGKLYVGVGENARGANAQSLDNRLGKILRYNPDGTIPADNPSRFAGIAGTTAGANRAIWAVGLRNPYTFAFRPGTGRMLINDVGANAFEEINEGRAGANYGWPATEGDFNQAAFPDFTRPFYAYAHGGGVFQGFAISGGAFYDPPASAPARFPASFDGDYFFADFSNDWINVLDAGTGSVARFASAAPGVVDLRVAADGSLLYLARGANGVFRVAPAAGQAPAIIQQPQGRAVALGGSASFAVVASGAAPLTYQWQRAEAGSEDFVAIPGAVAPGFTLANAQAGDDGDRFRVVVANASGARASAAATLSVLLVRRPRVPADYDGDGRTDIAAYLPTVGALAYRPSSGGPDVIAPFGQAGPGLSLPAAGDYDGDGRTDIAAYLAGPGYYAYRPSGGGPDVLLPFGNAGAGRSIPVPADYDGDGRDDVAVYLPSFGGFGIRPSAGGPDRIVPFGIAGAGQTLPAPGDYSGTGRADVAAYLPALGAFAIRPAGGGADLIIPFGLAGPGGSIPAPGDYDGDGRTDIAAYLPTLGLFAFRPSGGGGDVLTPFGGAGRGDIPVPGDYSGSGRAEVAVFAPPSATFARRPAGSGPDALTPFGAAGPGGSLPAAEPAGSVAASFAPRPGAARASTSPPSRPAATVTVTSRAAVPRRPAVAAPRPSGATAPGPGGEAAR